VNYAGLVLALIQLGAWLAKLTDDKIEASERVRIARELDRWKADLQKADAARADVRAHGVRPSVWDRDNTPGP
jgi:hypothetical protein